MYMRILIGFSIMLVFSTVLAKPAHIALAKSLRKYPVKTTLSKQALKLHLGMTKNQVIKLLGKPTWADAYKGEPLAWSWRNNQCNPVVVTFNKKMKVNGFDQGRARCLSTAYTEVPDDIYLCSELGQSHLCR